MYDCQTLLDLCPAFGDLSQFQLDGHKSNSPIFSGLQAYLRAPCPSLRRGHRRRGKHSGRLVKLKIFLACSSGTLHFLSGNWIDRLVLHFLGHFGSLRPLFNPCDRLRCWALNTPCHLSYTKPSVPAQQVHVITAAQFSVAF